MILSQVVLPSDDPDDQNLELNLWISPNYLEVFPSLDLIMRLIIQMPAFCRINKNWSLQMLYNFTQLYIALCLDAARAVRWRPASLARDNIEQIIRWRFKCLVSGPSSVSI